MALHGLAHTFAVQGCANILQHSCVASEGQSGASMWDPSSHRIHSILTGKVWTAGALWETSSFLFWYRFWVSRQADRWMALSGRKGILHILQSWLDSCLGSPMTRACFFCLVHVQDCSCCNILQHSCVASDGQSGSPMWDAHYTLHSVLTGKVCQASLMHDCTFTSVCCLRLQLVLWFFGCICMLITDCPSLQDKTRFLSILGMPLQLSTTEGNSYYVGTKMDAFVFDTLNSWYQEDAGVNSVSAHALALKLILFKHAQWSHQHFFMKCFRLIGWGAASRLCPRMSIPAMALPIMVIWAATPHHQITLHPSLAEEVNRSAQPPDWM